MMCHPRYVLVLSLPILAAACSTADHSAKDTTSAGMTPGAASSSGVMMNDSAGKMGAMGGMHADTVVVRVQRDLAAMNAASGDAIVPLVAAHRQTVEALIADCAMMMKQMKMSPPRKWTNAVASLHEDLSKMTTANAAGLHAMWPDHRQRVQGMLDMRHDMMKM